MSANKETLVELTGDVGVHNTTEPVISIGGFSLEGSILERSIASDPPFSRKSSRIGRRRLWRY